jgi:hypothetical protein
VLVAFGFVGFAFSQNKNEGESRQHLNARNKIARPAEEVANLAEPESRQATPTERLKAMREYASAAGWLAEGEREMTEKSQSVSALTVGDIVMLVPESLAWRAEMTLQGQIGEVIERRDDGRVTVRFDNGRLLTARKPDSFERVSGLKAKGK